MWLLTKISMRLRFYVPLGNKEQNYQGTFLWIVLIEKKMWRAICTCGSARDCIHTSKCWCNSGTKWPCGILKSTEEVKGIPSFWLTVFKNVDMLSDMIQVGNLSLFGYMYGNYFQEALSSRYVTSVYCCLAFEHIHAIF